ncbi:MAG: hypothetical protein A2Y40_01970 [Candidatus Margulisbacteria bacterium GWF2_35_9]|nr:MAG: hypothetical protein A2Y40_01970 [Candidatus Margulisbacteria bacterium GWF2_35_9]
MKKFLFLVFFVFILQVSLCAIDDPFTLSEDTLNKLPDLYQLLYVVKNDIPHEKDFFISPYIAYHYFDSKRGYDSYTDFGLFINKQIGHRWFVDIGAGIVPTKYSWSTEERAFFTYFANAEWEFQFYRNINPYLMVGLAGDLSGATNLGLDFGFGAKFFYHPTIVPKLEYRYISYGDKGFDQLLLLAFHFPLNYPTHIVDSDHDSVGNYLDQCPNTPFGSEVDERGCFTKINLNINFKTDKYDVEERYYTRIQEFVKFLKDNPELKVRIEGHTDNVGSKEYNQKLSENRARSVAEFIYGLGIKQSQVSYIGFGLTQAVADNDTEEGRAINRRIEAVRN